MIELPETRVEVIEGWWCPVWESVAADKDCLWGKPDHDTRVRFTRTEKWEVL